MIGEVRDARLLSLEEEEVVLPVGDPLAVGSACTEGFLGFEDCAAPKAMGDIKPGEV